MMILNLINVHVRLDVERKWGWPPTEKMDIRTTKPDDNCNRTGAEY